MWLIDVHNGFGDTSAVNIEHYPAIKRYLNQFYTHLEDRRDQGITPYNLRNCAYHEEFLREKIAWIDLVKNGRFAYDSRGFLCDKTCFILTGTHIKYLCALLNSTLVRWFFQQEAPTSGMGVFLWGKVYVEKIPIPKITLVAEKSFTRIVDQIISHKRNNRENMIPKLENELDRLVYKTYGLTHKEVSVIEK